MRGLILVSALAGALGVSACASTPAGPATYVAAAVTDVGRPEADRARDLNRKPAEMLVFAGIKPGMKVGELAPGGGYFTRIFSKAVGPAGRVYAVVAPPRNPGAFATDPAYSNITVIREPNASWKAPEPLDVVWTSQNYHDWRTDPAAILAVNKAVFNALKPGGVYIVLDHAAAAGSTDRSLHRIDPALVKADVLAAGFEFVGESTALRNPADNHTVRVQDGAIRGTTDQFIYKFRRPRR